MFQVLGLSAHSWSFQTAQQEHFTNVMNLDIAVYASHSGRCQVFKEKLHKERIKHVSRLQTIMHTNPTASSRDDGQGVLF